MKEKEIRPVILCSKKVGLLIKIKSGGRDYEGISYRSEYPFVMLDLSNLNKIKIDLSEETAWVQAGATVGQFYYAIAKRSKVHGFPDERRFVLGDKRRWRSKFGVILRWKLKLVRVPEKLTVFTIRRKLEGNRDLLQKWENISHQLPEDLFIRAAVQNGRSSAGNITKKHVQFYFQAQYLGPVDELIPLLKQYFPEFNLGRNDCFQENTTADAEKECQERIPTWKNYSKGTSDFVKTPIPESGWEMIERLLSEEERFLMIMEPLGGKLDNISESEIPFPLRKGNFV
ncbi:hypothetical protein P3S68_017375 [Capsicum galapagoense]